MMRMSENSKEVSYIETELDKRLKILDDQELEDIHQATLKVLKEEGVRFPSTKALEVFVEAGAQVDFKTKNVKIPSDLLMETLEKAPKSFTLASRGNPDLDLKIEVEGKKTYFATDGTGTTTIDLITRNRRPSTKADVGMMALVSDYLPAIGFYWPMVSAQDMPSSVRSLHELEAALTNTEKHIQLVSCTGQNQARYAVEMVTLIAGDSESLRNRPPLSLVIGPVSPLAHDKGGIEAALTFAEAGIPVGFMTMPTIGGTSPATLAGTLVQGNVEILSAITLVQLRYPGTPIYYSLVASMLNPHTGGALTGVPPVIVLQAAGVQLGHYYNLPVATGCGGSDTHKPGAWQVGKQDTIGPLSLTLCGPELAIGLGLLETSTLLYPEKILFDNEIFKTVKVLAEGVKVNPETLAVDEIMEVGPRGHFLTKKFTQKNLRKLWDPGITHQWSPEENDFRDLQEAAVEKINWILENHRPKPLDKKVKREMKKIIEKAEMVSSSE